MTTKKAFLENIHYSMYGTGIKSYPYIMFDHSNNQGWKYMVVFQKGTTKKDAIDLAYKWIYLMPSYWLVGFR